MLLELRLTILFSFFALGSILGQTNLEASKFGRSESNVLPSEYKLDIPAVRANVLEVISADIPSPEWTVDAYRFSDEVAASVAQLLSSGEIYSDWPELEAYLNEVLRRVMPDELKNDPIIHAYLRKAGSFNAFMTPTGLTFINIGLFAHVEDEASLAGILAHELAHYYKNHSFKGYVKSLQGDFRPKLFVSNRASSQFSIENELEADELALKWMSEAGYNTDGLVKDFNLFKTIEENTLLRSKDQWELKETTHPKSEKRLAQLEKFVKEEPVKGADFLVSEEKFLAFKEEAKVEVLKHLLESRQFSSCIETGFKFHLLDPENSTYLYYLMESIRRRCYLNPTLWQENFITERYHYIKETERGRSKFKTDKHIFDNYPLSVILMNESEEKEIEATFYWDELKFVSNAEAFDFFFAVSQLFNEPECVFSNALSVVGNDSIRAAYLQEYLSFPDIRYRDYAQSLLDDQIRSKFSNNKLTVLSDFEIKQRLKKDDVMVVDDFGTNRAIHQKLIDSVANSLENRTSLFMPTLKEKELVLYRQLRDLEDFSFTITVSVGQVPELHVINPNYWDVLNYFGVNEIEFVNIFYMEQRAEEPTMDNYKAAREQSYVDVLEREKGVRYVEVIVTSVRDIKNGATKIRYYGGNNKLGKRPVFDQLVTQVRDCVRMKIKRGAELDRWNK